uniref:CASP-like protein n=1 Tax=Gossypium raimondii TaxID=29730 RepID=A0A0D2M6C8_GOSRA|nr:hypothetical protein B456_002G037500 [Gossypium raimondii]
MEKSEKGNGAAPATRSPMALMGSSRNENQEVNTSMRTAETMLRYLVHANGICAGYSLLSAIIAAVPRPSTMPRAWTFFLLDQILTYIILGAAAVSTEVLYLANKGDSAITWSAACGTFAGFCHKATIAVVITFVAVICYAVLSLVSSYRLFTKFDAPVNYPSKTIEATVFHG